VNPVNPVEENKLTCGEFGLQHPLATARGSVNREFPRTKAQLFAVKIFALPGLLSSATNF